MRNSSFAESDTPEIRQESVLEWTRFPLCQKCVCLPNHTIINNKNKLLKLAMTTWLIQVVKSCDPSRFRTSVWTIFFSEIARFLPKKVFFSLKTYKFYLSKIVEIWKNEIFFVPNWIKILQFWVETLENRPSFISK